MLIARRLMHAPTAACSSHISRRCHRPCSSSLTVSPFWRGATAHGARGAAALERMVVAEVVAAAAAAQTTQTLEAVASEPVPRFGVGAGAA